MIEISEQMLADLREHVMSLMSPKRFRHTVAVEEMAARLAALFCPAQTNQLRAAALLHDITKERTAEEQEQLCLRHGLPVSDDDRLAPKTFHARTAAENVLQRVVQHMTQCQNTRHIRRRDDDRVTRFG